MLSNLLNIPKDENSWEEYLWNNRDQINNIQQAIKKKYNINLTQYILYPVSRDGFQDFLEANQQSHEDFNAVLGLQSSDLESVDISNPQQVSAWVYLSYQELYSASAALGI